MSDERQFKARRQHRDDVTSSRDASILRTGSPRVIGLEPFCGICGRGRATREHRAHRAAELRAARAR